MEWTPFWDSYSSSIHENPNLSDIDKFNDLHSLLEKSAAEAISGLKITSANYQEAIDILDKRFGNQQQIVNSGRLMHGSSFSQGRNMGIPSWARFLKRKQG